MLPEKIRCHMTRTTNGSRHVPWQIESDVHWIASMIPGASIPGKFHRFVRLFIFTVSVILFFVAPWTGIFMSAYWIHAGWINGSCHHCRGRNERE